MSAEVVQLKIKKFSAVLDGRGNPVPGYTVHRQTGIIYYRKTFKKMGIPPLNISTGERTLSRAKTMAEMAVQRHKNKYLGVNDTTAFGRRKSQFTFKEIGLNVLELHTPKQRNATQYKHRQFVRELIDKWGSFDPDTITPALFDEWIESLRKQRRHLVLPNGKTMKSHHYRTSFEDYAKHMNLVMRWGYEKMKVCSHLIRFSNPDKALIHGRKGRVYSEDEIDRVWNALNPDVQDQFLLSYECMMRLQEGLKLTWDRFDLKTGKVTLRAEDVKTGSKTGKGREFYLSPEAHRRLKVRWERRSMRLQKSPYIFPSPRNMMRPVGKNKTAWDNAKKAAGITGKATWHHLRHTAITRALIDRKHNQIEVSRYAGVSLHTIDRTYLHSTAEDTSEVRNAVTVGKRCELGVNGESADEK